MGNSNSGGLASTAGFTTESFSSFMLSGSRSTNATHREILSSFFEEKKGFRFIRDLSNGTFMKSVHYETKDGTPVVIKLFLHPKKSTTAQQLMSFERYERILKTLRDQFSPSNHPNVLPYQQFYYSSSSSVGGDIPSPVSGYEYGILVRQYLWMNLRDRLSTHPFLTYSEKWWLFFQLLQALAQLHSNGVFHGDIKPENILVTSKNWLVVTDISNVLKPTFVPRDKPDVFHYFFVNQTENNQGKPDLSLHEKRSGCYLAPERLVPAQNSTGMRGTSSTKAAEVLDQLMSAEVSVEEANQHLAESQSQYSFGVRVTEKMDVFSAGCILAELFLESSAPFDFSELLTYSRLVARKKGIRASPMTGRTLADYSARGTKSGCKFDVQQLCDLSESLAPGSCSGLILDDRLADLLNKLPDNTTRFFFLHMIQNDPTNRYSAAQYIQLVQKQVGDASRQSLESLAFLQDSLYNFMANLVHCPGVDDQVMQICKHYKKVVDVFKCLESGPDRGEMHWEMFFEERHCLWEQQTSAGDVGIRDPSTVKAPKPMPTSQLKKDALSMLEAFTKGLQTEESVDPAFKVQCEDELKHRQAALKSTESFSDGAIPTHHILLRPASQASKSFHGAGMIVVVHVLLQNLRHCSLESTRVTCLWLVFRLSNFLDDGLVITRILPYLVSYLSDSRSNVQLLALRLVAKLLEQSKDPSVKAFKLFQKYLFPNLKQLFLANESTFLSPFTAPTGNERLVKLNFAYCLSILAQVCKDYIEQTGILMARKELSSTPVMEEALQRKKLLSVRQEQRHHLVDMTTFFDAVIANIRETQYNIKNHSAKFKLLSRSLMKNIGQLSLALGEGYTNEVLLKTLVTFLNERNHFELKLSFLEKIATSSLFLGPDLISKYLITCMEELLFDTHFVVVVKAFSVFATLIELDLLLREKIVDLCLKCRLYLFHPVKYVRVACLNYFAAAFLSKLFTQLDIKVLFINGILDTLMLENVSVRLYGFQSVPMKAAGGLIADSFDQTRELVQLLQNNLKPAISADLYAAFVDFVSQVLPLLQDSRKPVEGGVLKRSFLQHLESEGFDSNVSENAWIIFEGVFPLLSAEAPKELKTTDEHAFFPRSEQLLALRSLLSQRQELKREPTKWSTVYADLLTAVTQYSLSELWTPSQPYLPLHIAFHKSDTLSRDLYAKFATFGPQYGLINFVIKKQNNIYKQEKNLTDLKMVHRAISLGVSKIGTDVGHLSTFDGKEYSYLSSTGTPRFLFPKRDSLPSKMVILDPTGSSSYSDTGAEELQVFGAETAFDSEIQDRTKSSRFTPKGKLLRSIHDEVERVNKIAVAEDSSFFITVSDSGSLRVYLSDSVMKRDHMRSLLNYQSQSGKLTDCVILKNSHTIASASTNGTVHIFRLNYVQQIRKQMNSNQLPLPNGYSDKTIDMDSQDSFDAVGSIRRKSLSTAIVLKLNYRELGGISYLHHVLLLSRSLLVILTDRNYLVVFDLRNEREVAKEQFTLKFGTITTSDCIDELVVCGTSKGVLFIYDLKTQEILKAFYYLTETRKIGSNRMYGLYLRKLPVHGKQEIVVNICSHLDQVNQFVLRTGAFMKQYKSVAGKSNESKKDMDQAFSTPCLRPVPPVSLFEGLDKTDGRLQKYWTEEAKVLFPELSVDDINFSDNAVLSCVSPSASLSRSIYSSKLMGSSKSTLPTLVDDLVTGSSKGILKYWSDDDCHTVSSAPKKGYIYSSVKLRNSNGAKVFLSEKVPVEKSAPLTTLATGCHQDLITDLKMIFVKDSRGLQPCLLSASADGVVKIWV